MSKWTRAFRRFAGKDSPAVAIKRRRLKESRSRKERRAVRRALRQGEAPPEFRRHDEKAVA